MVDLGAILLAAISLPVKPFLCKEIMTACVSLQVTMVDRGRTTHTCVNKRVTDMMSAGPFLAGLKCSGNVFGGIQLILHGKEGLCN